MRLLKRVLAVVGVVCVGAVLVFLGVAFFLAQRADYGWRPRVDRPRHGTVHPRVLFDEGHNNASTVGFVGRYWPFARLLRADGYEVVRGQGPFTAEGLDCCRVLVIANAAGNFKLQVFGINMPVPDGGRERSDPAFTPAEIQAVVAWVEKGGSLLLVADHAPFGQSAADLATALGVTMHKGFVEVPGERSDPLLFSRENGRLGDHPILRGDAPDAEVRRVMTYTGESLTGPSGSTVLLKLPATATEDVPADGGDFVKQPAGEAQGLAFTRGRGRVVVLGEGGMLTAQVNERRPYGMNADNDDRQFALNTLHWLSHIL